MMKTQDHLRSKRCRCSQVPHKVPKRMVEGLIYPFVQEVKDNPHKFLCNICMRQVACDHQGKHDIERHMEKAMHQANVEFGLLIAYYFYYMHMYQK